MMINLHEFNRGQKIRTRGGQVGYICHLESPPSSPLTYPVNILVWNEEEGDSRYIERCYTWDGKWLDNNPTDLDVVEVFPNDKDSSGFEEALLEYKIDRMWGGR